MSRVAPLALLLIIGILAALFHNSWLDSAAMVADIAGPKRLKDGKG